MAQESNSHHPSVNDDSIHPGQHVRATVLGPKNLSVTEAAGIVGVSRPAFSNFLNGKVETTQDMAARIERAFGVPAQTLLDMQAAFGAAKAKERGAPASTKVYVPPFLAIKADALETWATSNIEARRRFSVLLRTLVNSTGVGLKKVDFPGNDDAERPGWDGFIEAAEGTPWIPEGLSGWEFGVDRDIKGKADRDFTKSVKATDKSDRRRTTFIFVTPRRWSRKNRWIAENKAKGQWEDVRAYDSSDLEQWLEQSLPGQTWFANETERPTDGVRSLDKTWSDWAELAEPPLTGALFRPAVNSAVRLMNSWLASPPNEPVIIAADSVDEALAFLAQLFGKHGGALAAHRDRVLVFDRPGILPRLAQGGQHFIAVAANRDVERELSPLARTMHTIVVYPRNAVNGDPHVVLEPLTYEPFRTALEEMGYGRDDIQKYSNESGRSLTVLRRRLSAVRAVRTPLWVADRDIATSLTPFMLIGAWNSANEADREVLELLANGNSYENLEKQCQRLTYLDDAPIWSLATYRGVVSKIDLLFAIAPHVTEPDLRRYFDLAEIVLGEDDPALDVPEDKRVWAQVLYGKSREFSAAARKGLSETLVLLAIHGNHLFKSRLGFDAEAEAEGLVRRLLVPLSTRRLEANSQDLPTYAEAVPDVFLSILEDDLAEDEPASIALMRPISPNLFGAGCSRSGLLWALEGLAWSANTLPRAGLILARLAEVELDDNWANKPINSLEAIFRVWMPQTAASHDQRLAVMRLLAERSPRVAWKVCVNQFGFDHQTGFYSHKPHWRADAHGFGEPFTDNAPIVAFKREMIEMALGWAPHTREMLSDLIERLPNLADDHQQIVWKLIKSWADNACDADKASIREKIRVTVMSRRGLKRSRGTAAGFSVAAKKAYESLEPSDLLNKHAWLFRQAWVEESAEELDDDQMNFQKRDERIAKLRAEALREVLDFRGMDGVVELAEMGNAASQIGRLMATEVLDEEGAVVFLVKVLAPTSENDSWPRKNLIYGALNALQDDAMRARLIEATRKQLPSQSKLVRLLLFAPFRRSTWNFVDQLDEMHQKAYWADVLPHLPFPDENEADEAIKRLLAADRPLAAFNYIQYSVDSIQSGLLFRLLSEIAKGAEGEPGDYKLDQYHLEKAFSQIDNSGDLTLEQKAGLEFAFVDVLSKPWSEHEGYGIPNLERYVEANPEFFVAGYRLAL